jgi:protein involved in polysaccharide export with SLBB domain
LETEIREFYVPGGFPNLTVTVLASSGNFVYVDGEVRIPGRYPWTNGMRLKDAIEAAGGFNDFSNRRIRLVHSDGTAEKYRVRGDWTATINPELKPGDKVSNRQPIVW